MRKMLYTFAFALLLVCTGCSVHVSFKSSASVDPSQKASATTSSASATTPSPTSSTSRPSGALSGPREATPVLPTENPGTKRPTPLLPTANPAGVEYSFTLPSAFKQVQHKGDVRFFVTDDHGTLVVMSTAIQPLGHLGTPDGSSIAICKPISKLENVPTSFKEKLLLAKGKAAGMMEWDTRSCAGGDQVTARWEAYDDSFNAYYEGPLAHLDGITAAFRDMTRVIPR